MQKKGDALATQGACAVDLSSVWGFKGRNPLGGVTILADFDFIALTDREAYICNDSDYRENPWVRKATERLEELCQGDVSETTLRLVHEAKKRGAVITNVEWKG